MPTTIHGKEEPTTGYTTDFYGEFTVTPPLSEAHRAYLAAFAATRRMKRDANKALLLPDPLRIAAGLPIGHHGAYYVGGVNDGNFGQSADSSVLDHNEPPGNPSTADYSTDPAGTKRGFNEWYTEYEGDRQAAIAGGQAQPGLWCQWVPSEDGTAIRWDGGEKFYEYVAWIKYLVRHFLEPWGYKLNGEVEWQGEERDDMGLIRITDNLVEIGVADIQWKF